MGVVATHDAHRTRRRVIKIAFGILPIAVALRLILPRIGDFERAGPAIVDGSWLSIVLLIVFETASLVAYGLLIRTVLRSMGQEASFGLIQRTTIVGTSLGRTLPGGSTTALAVVVNALRKAGLDPTRTTAAIATSGILSSFVLAVLLVPATAAAIVGGQSVTVAVGAGVVAVCIIAVVLAIVPLVRHPAGVGTLVERILRRIVPDKWQEKIDPKRAGVGAEHAVAGVRQLIHDPRSLSWGLGFAAANWLFDLAALTAVAVTIGRGTPLTALPLAYVVGQLAAAVPLTPGGIGIVETAMIGSLVAAGAPVAAATATVLGWRIFSFWLPILAGLGFLPTLPRRPHDGVAEEGAAP